MEITKQLKRELRERDIVIKTIAMLSVQGFLDLKMADVAKTVSCSMGVVYSHFASKEDLLLACAIKLTQKQQALLTMVSLYQLSNAQQVALFALMIWDHNEQYPGQSEIMPMACLPSVWKRASAIRVNELSRVGAQIEQVMRPRFAALLTTTGQDAAKSQNMMCGMMGLVIGMWNIQSSGFGMIDVCMQEMTDKNPLIENLIRYFNGWGIDFTFTVDEWLRLQTIAREIINMTENTENKE